MHRKLSPRALKRAQWISDLASALVEAEKLLMMMEAGGGFPQETARLRLRVEAARTELALLDRASLCGRRVVGGEWPSTIAGHT